ncbi:MAG: DNA-3-methyladenine glycosylase 2 family protein [Oscillospiraceae bacterium]|nr:DNA-3-methyladenine glycosylase 2 family protein [Oscillospiraceae bacterium]
MKQYFEYSDKETEYLKSKDEKIAKLIDKAGHIYREINPDFYANLVDSIMGQQISTAAHNTIRKRVAEKLGGLTARKINAVSDEDLKSIGLSWRKVGYIRDFTDKVISGEFDIEALYDMDDGQVVKELVKLKGVGKWTAEMVLTFCMARPDVLSYGDLAIRRGIMRLYGLEELSEKDFDTLTARFAPYRTTAALYIWYYANPECTLVIK